MKTFLRSICAATLVLGIVLSLQAATVPDSTWQPVITTDGSELTARHEAAAVEVDGLLYLLGGRGNRPVERFSNSTGQWENLGLAPRELHHMQPVAIGKRIYLVGAFTCCFPREELVPEIHVFDTETGLWSVEGLIPEGRVRGGAGAAVRDGKIYLLGGNTQGHDGGAVPWFDEYDPATGVWRELPDAPNARDHFGAVIVADQLVAAAGRQTALPSPAANPVLDTDIYDFDSGVWRSAARIPTARSGVVAVKRGSHVVVAGGEINTSSLALDVVEAFDIDSDTWKTWPAMNTGRHGSGGGIVDDRFIMMSGATTIGGASESGGSEFLALPELVPDPAPEEPPEETPEEPPEEPPVEIPEEIPEETPVEIPEEEAPETTPEETPEPEAARRRSGAFDGFLIIALLMLVGQRRRRAVASKALAV